MNQKILDFWNERAAKGVHAGSDDFILKELESRAICNHITEKTNVLDVGCGNGDTLFNIIEKKNCSGMGIDFSSGMIDLANAQKEKHKLHDDTIKFRVSSVIDLPKDIKQFDYVISQRCLINLANVEEQYHAFKSILNYVKPGGYYLMTESFAEGLERTNTLRKDFGLEPILPPWHNVFFNENTVKSWATEDVKLIETLPLSSTYHFLSRVIYAHVAKIKNEELRYDSDINMMSLGLPVIGNFGPVNMYVWQKTK